MSSSTSAPAQSSTDDEPRPLPTTLFNGFEASIQTHLVPVVTVTSTHGDMNESLSSVLLSEKETNDMLLANEQSFSAKSAALDLTADVNALPSNEPIEDAWAFDAVHLDKLHDDNFWKSWQDAKGEDGDMVFASVFDGHRGYQLANILSRVAHACLARAIARLETRSPDEMKRVIMETIEAIDADLCSSPEAIAGGNLQIGKNDLLPNPPPAFFGAIGLMDCRGSCGTTAIIDVKNGEMYVANLGDSRAVAGWKNEDGGWRCDTLTRDMTPDDPYECEQVYAAHPDEPKEELVTDVGTGRRLIGVIRVTRAYGDQWLKSRGFELNKQVQTTLGNSHAPFKIKNGIPCDKPPYMTATAEVTHRSIKPESGEKLGFVILAVDGGASLPSTWEALMAVFDRLSSEESALITASHLAHPSQPDIPRSALSSQIELSVTKPRPWPQAPIPGTPEYKPREVGSWVYEHPNSATHLIVNSLAGAGDRNTRRQVLSMRGDAARYMRDDMTAMCFPSSVSR